MNGTIGDQARGLRDLLRQPIPATATQTPVFIIGSGKGGVGKSLTAVAFAMAAAESGRRTLLVDSDQNLGNLHVLLGVQPRFSLAELLNQDITPEDLLVPVRENLWLVPADSGKEATHGLGPTDRARLQHRVSTLYRDYDMVIVDCAAGLESATRAATIAASALFIVTLPESTALTDAYALIKIITRQLPALPIEVIVNRTFTVDEGPAAFERLAVAAQRFLGRELTHAGDVPDDSEVRHVTRDPSRLHSEAHRGTALAMLTAVANARIQSLAPAEPAVQS